MFHSGGVQKIKAAALNPVLRLGSGGRIETSPSLRHGGSVFVDKSAARHVGSLFLCMSPWYPDGMVPKAKKKSVIYLGTPPMF